MPRAFAAAKVQRSLLPATAPDAPQVRFAWKYLPCDELAGDFLNFFALDERRIAVYVVDVSGHGVASSLLAVTIGRTLTSQASATSLLLRKSPTGEMQIVPPAEVAAELNRRFPMEEQNGLYFTMLYGVLDLQTLEFRFCAAGHDPVVHVARGEAPQMIDADGLAIGWIEDMDYDEHLVQLRPGDRLYLYSDGVPEALDADMQQFGMQQMLEVMELGQLQPLADSVELLLDSVKRWCHPQGPKDDVSIVALEIADTVAPSA